MSTTKTNNQPPSVSRSLNNSWPATTLLPSSTSNSSMTPAPGDGTGIDVYNSVISIILSHLQMVVFGSILTARNNE